MDVAVRASAPLPALQMEEVAVAPLQGGSVPTVEDLSWTVQPGDYWVVGGLQGTGKTDLLIFAAGLTYALRGRYRMFGLEMPIFDEARLQERQRVGMVFDGGQLVNHLTVRENVALPLRYHRDLSRAEAEPEVQALLEATELTPWADSTPGAISRHWHKRAGLARALALRPEILLVDNPLAGLDWVHTTWWLNCLQQLSRGHPCLKGRPVTLVATTTDLRPWRDHARQFAALNRRRFTVLGTWAHVEGANARLVHDLLGGQSASD